MFLCLFWTRLVSGVWLLSFSPGFGHCVYVCVRASVASCVPVCVFFFHSVALWYVQDNMGRKDRGRKKLAAEKAKRKVLLRAYSCAAIPKFFPGKFKSSFCCPSGGQNNGYTFL